MEDARDLIGQTVLVKLTSNEGLGFAGVPGDGPFFCTVVAVDEIGIWVKNKSFVTMEIKDAKGRYIPRERQKPERHVVNILLPWRIVHAVVLFEKGYAVELKGEALGNKSPDSGRIGFMK
jgi:hypothetical protein